MKNAQYGYGNGLVKIYGCLLGNLQPSRFRLKSCICWFYTEIIVGFLNPFDHMNSCNFLKGIAALQSFISFFLDLQMTKTFFMKMGKIMSLMNKEERFLIQWRAS